MLSASASHPTLMGGWHTQGRKPLKDAEEERRMDRQQAAEDEEEAYDPKDG